ncbi:MAG: SAM-dependent methyltransferase, partial [Arachnia propionica]
MEGYESFALRYDAGSQISPFNKFDRATVLGMRSDWRGLRVLEVGCAGGLLATQLIDAGANVTAFDLSPTLVALAGERAPSANIYVHDIRQPIPEPDGQFDVVVASLVLHYVQDWNPVFEDARRVLRPGGSLIVTTGHPL